MADLPTRYAFYFDGRACSGCKACQVACKDKHGLEVGRLWRRVYEVSGGGWRQDGNAWHTDVFAYNLSIACNHCDAPICAEVCPARAISQRPDGIVLLDPDMCLGCGYCRWACPYGALQFDESAGHMTKCTFCVDEIDAGRPPACVAACPMRVLDFGDQTALQTRYGSTNGTAPLPSSALTGPALVITPHRDARRGAEPDTAVSPGRQLPMKEWPLIAFTLLVQLAAGAMLFTAALWIWIGGVGKLATADHLTSAMMWVIEPAILIAMLVSTMHLGKPYRAYRALRNLGSSWLSREILLAGLFAGAGFLVLAAGWLDGGPFWLRTTLALIAAGLGLALVYSMARVYRLRTVPTWNSPAVVYGFMSTAILLGGMSAVLMVLGQYGPITAAHSYSGGGWDSLSIVLFAAVIAVVAASAVVPHALFFHRWWRDARAAIEGLSSDPSISRLVRLRWLAAGLGVLTMFFVLLQPLPPAGQPMPFSGLAVLAFWLIFAGEVAGRFLFYKAYHRCGV